MISSTRKHIGTLVLALVVAALLAVAAGTARGMPTGSARATDTATYADPPGDAHGGPDITAVTVDVNRATGMLQIQVSAPGFTSAPADGQERGINVWIDSDRNAATGDPQDGTDYVIAATTDPTGTHYWSFGHWNGSTWADATPSSGAGCSSLGDSVHWTVPTSDLGGSTAFRFFVQAGVWNTSSNSWTAQDDAPDLGMSNYPAAATAPTPPPTTETQVSLSIGTPKTTPGQAVAGKPFTITFPVQFVKVGPATTIDVSTGQITETTIVTWTAVPSGTVVCSSSVAGQTAARTATLKNGQARVSLVVPKQAKGKPLTVRVKVTATDKETGKTVSGTKAVTFRVH